MFKYLLASVFFALVVSSTFGQQNTQPANSQYTYQKAGEQQNATQTRSNQQLDYQRHWSFGGWFSLSFWNGGTDVLVAPKAYYHLSPKFLTGFGVTYIYSDYSDDFLSYHSNSIGGSIMVGARPVPQLQISAEYEGLNTTRSGDFPDTFWNNALYLGASFVSGPVSFGLRYDVLYDSATSAFGSPWTPVIGFYF